MQIQIQHIFGGKSRSGKSRDEQFVDHAIALFPDGGACRCGGMTGDDQPNVRSSRREGAVRAIVKGTQSSTFRMSANFNGRTRQNRLDRNQIQESIVTTAPDESHICVQDIFEYSGVAIQAIQPHQDLGEEELVRRCVTGDDLESPLQFFPVIAVARSPKRAQELMRMGLQKRGAGSHDFPPLASLVPWGCNLIETAMGGG